MIYPKNVTRFMLALVLVSLSATPTFAADVYKLDPMHTAVLFHINHFGFSNPTGKFMSVDGTLTLDEQNPANSQLNVTIPVGDVDTGIAKLNEHIKSKDFFDAATFPTATYVSNKVDVTGKDTAIVHGTLTLHGVSKPVDLNVKLNKIGDNMKNVKTAGFSAETTIKRSDFGITTYVPALSDEVRLEIETEANIASGAK